MPSTKIHSATVLPENEPSGRRGDWAARAVALTPYLLALFFGLWSLRGVGRTDVVDTDAARHAMNGAFFYDLVRGGHIGQTVEYAKEYYGRLPALTMPYHPPVFPAIEAVFFALFGVKLLSARLAVAAAVGICSWLLYRLVEATLGNRVIAVCATITTLSLLNVQSVATDVMLEFPAMAFTLAALYCLRDTDRALPLRRALLFAIFAATALWTKQHAAFLCAVPFILAVLNRRWRLLTGTSLWVAMAIPGATAVCWYLLYHHFYGSRLDANMVGTTPQHLRVILWKNIELYAGWIARAFHGLPSVFAVCSVAVFAWSLRKQRWHRLGVVLYVAWIIPAALILLVLGAVDQRYLFFLFPPVVVIGYALLWRGCSDIWGERRAGYVLAAFAVAWLAVGFSFQPDYLRGPGEAARLVTAEGPSHVLYAGEGDGNFVFAVRTFDANLQTIVIPAEKLPPSTFEPVALERFCREYGISWVVFEDVPIEHKWSAIRTAPPQSLQLRQSIPLESSRSRWRNGTIKVYRFSGPADDSGEVLELPVKKLDRPIKVKF